MHGLHDLGCRDRPGMREAPAVVRAKKMIAMSVGDVNCGEVLAARDDPVQQVCDCSIVRKVSTRTASRPPWMSVDEFATHISLSLPAGRSRVRPGRLIVSTSQLRPASVFQLRHRGLRDYLRKMPDAIFSYDESCGQTCESGLAGVRTDQMLAEPLGCGGFCHWKLVAIGVEVSRRDKPQASWARAPAHRTLARDPRGNRIVRRDDHQQRVGECAGAQTPGSYMRASLVDRIVHVFSHSPPHRAVGGRNRWRPLARYEAGMRLSQLRRLAPRGFTPGLVRARHRSALPPAPATLSGAMRPRPC